jgi:hypothetical protein
MADRVNIGGPGYQAFFESKDGPIGRDLERRATRVQLAAKAQTGVKTGMLKRDIVKQWVSANGKRLTIRVGSDRKYAYWHHEGTRPHIIRARNAKYLRFVNKAGKVVYARSVNHPGTSANRYLTDNIHLAGG